jgi:hypothetical protein
MIVSQLVDELRQLCFQASVQVPFHDVRREQVSGAGCG